MSSRHRERRIQEDKIPRLRSGLYIYWIICVGGWQNFMSIHALFDALFEEERKEFEREKEKDEGEEEEKRGTKAYLHFESANLQVSQTTALTSVTQRAATKPTVEAIADILENICSCSRRARK